MLEASIIIPVHNAEQYLRECLDSVVAQSLRDIEIICIENGSSDGSSEILVEYAAKDARIRVLCDESGRGAGAARNVGLKAAAGEWLYFVDADDVVGKACLSAAVGFAENANADVVVFGAEEYDNATGMVTPLPLDLSVAPDDDSFLRAYATCPWNKMFRRSFIRERDILFQEIPRSNDLAFVVEALCRAQKIAVLDETLYSYRIHGGGGLQESKSETPFVWRDALDDAKRRLVAAGVFETHAKAFDMLCSDVRLSNVRSLPAKVLASIRRRGVRSFLKHAFGAVIRKFIK